MMDYPRCPSCSHELFDWPRGTCPYCGVKLPSGIGRSSSTTGPPSGVKPGAVILIALLIVMLAAGLVFYFAAVETGKEKDSDRQQTMVDHPVSRVCAWNARPGSPAGLQGSASASVRAGSEGRQTLPVSI